MSDFTKVVVDIDLSERDCDCLNADDCVPRYIIKGAEVYEQQVVRPGKVQSEKIGTLASALLAEKDAEIARLKVRIDRVEFNLSEAIAERDELAEMCQKQLDTHMKQLQSFASSLPQQPYVLSPEAMDLVKERDTHKAQAFQLREAGERIMAEPYGCPFCDSGVLRTPYDPLKEHTPECGFFMLRKALTATADLSGLSVIGADERAVLDAALSWHGAFSNGAETPESRRARGYLYDRIRYYKRDLEALQKGATHE